MRTHFDAVMFSPLPPKANGIADYCRELLRPLSREKRCAVIVEDATPRADAPDGVLVLEETEYRAREAAFDKVPHIYQIGNNPDHVYMLPFIARRPGLLVLHDPVAHHLLDSCTAAVGDVDAYCQALEAEYGAPGHLLAQQFREHGLRDTAMFFDLPMLGGLVGPARGVIVHSRYAAMKVRARVPTAPVRVVPHPYCPPARGQIKTRAAVRAQLRMAANEILLLSLGFVTHAKRISDVLEALASVRDRMPPFRYVIAGEQRRGEIDVPAQVMALGLEDCVTLLGYVPEAEFSSLIHASDVVLNLRHPVGGETSGTMIRALGSGACVIVVDRGAFAEIPSGAAVKLRWGNGFRDRLADELLALARDPRRRGRIGRAASAWIRSHNTPEQTAAGYVAAMREVARTPPPAWHSAAIWESPPPRELARLIEVASDRTRMVPLPRWFRSGAVTGSEAPCRVLRLGGGETDDRLLALMGHRWTRVEQPSVAALKAIAPRTLDLILFVASVHELPRDTVAVLRRINRALGFGGVLAINLRRHSGDAEPHALENHVEGTQLLRSCGFSVDFTSATTHAELVSDIASPPDGRSWRAVKVGEFRVDPSARSHQHGLQGSGAAG